MHTPSYRSGGAQSNPSTPHLGPLPTSGSTTALAATANPTSISGFMLDSRAPPGERYSYGEQEAQRERQIEEEARRLMAETKLWRLANSAMWVAWGIVQAHVPGLPDFDSEDKKPNNAHNKHAAELESATLELRAEAEAEEEEQKNGAVSSDNAGKKDSDFGNETEQDAELFKPQDEEEFDYLAYAQDRAMFLWGDALRMGLIKAEELPKEVQERVKMVEY
jgi:choline kinase